MSEIVEFLTDCGRLVQGSLYEPQTEDAEGNPLTIKKGNKSGQQRYDYFFSLAIQKSSAHWKDTPWGKIIWDTAHTAFPKGQADIPSFFWKIIDGDSDIPNQNDIPPSSRPGFKGCWILKLKSCFAPKIYNPRTKKYIPEENFISLGDYIQVYGFVLGNKSTQSPGVFLNPKYVAFQGYGEHIYLGRDATEIDFTLDIPIGAKTTPTGELLTTSIPEGKIVQELLDIKPYPEILEAPMPPMPPLASAPDLKPPRTFAPDLKPPRTFAPDLKPPRTLTDKAQGHSYEHLISLGWTDENLIKHGLMV